MVKKALKITRIKNDFIIIDTCKLKKSSFRPLNIKINARQRIKKLWESAREKNNLEISKAKNEYKKSA